MNVKHYQPVGFSKRLYDAFVTSGLDVTEISKRTGISRSSVYGYMYYGITPNIKALIALCVVLKVSSDYLLFGGGVCNT